MLRLFNKQLRRICSRLGWPARRRSRPKIVVRKFSRSNSRSHSEVKDNSASSISSAVIHPSSGDLSAPKSVRVATFNAALFSMAPAVPSNSGRCFDSDDDEFARKPLAGFDRPKSILKQSPLHPAAPEIFSSRQQKFEKSRLRVSINLPDNEISLKRSGQLSFPAGAGADTRVVNVKGKAPIRANSINSGSRTVVEVLKELNADILALQDVKAEEEKHMQPLSGLAGALGMKYVFAESWAPEYGNAILSKWPIKRWKAQKIVDDSDFRNVLKATIDVAQVGEINVFCTLLDHLDERWRMKQIDAIIQSTGVPHILAGGLNSLEETDYSQERWTDIVKYYEEMGKPTPKVEVMKYLKSKDYTDAKNFAGECESVVMIAKGQSVQGTCKYGTRVDYILSSENTPYKFVPGSYSVYSSKGTSDHHIVKVDVIKVGSTTQQCFTKKKKMKKTKQQQQQRTRTVKITHSSSPSKGIWKIHS